MDPPRDSASPNALFAMLGRPDRYPELRSLWKTDPTPVSVSPNPWFCNTQATQQVPAGTLAMKNVSTTRFCFTKCFVLKYPGDATGTWSYIRYEKRIQHQLLFHQLLANSRKTRTTCSDAAKQTSRLAPGTIYRANVPSKGFW